MFRIVFIVLYFIFHIFILVFVSSYFYLLFIYHVVFICILLCLFYSISFRPKTQVESRPKAYVVCPSLRPKQHTKVAQHSQASTRLDCKPHNRPDPARPSAFGLITSDPCGSRVLAASSPCTRPSCPANSFNLCTPLFHRNQATCSSPCTSNAHLLCSSVQAYWPFLLPPARVPLACAIYAPAMTITFPC